MTLLMTPPAMAPVLIDKPLGGTVGWPGVAECGVEIDGAALTTVRGDGVDGGDAPMPEKRSNITESAKPDSTELADTRVDPGRRKV